MNRISKNAQIILLKDALRPFARVRIAKQVHDSQQWCNEDTDGAVRALDYRWARRVMRLIAHRGVKTK